jgi:hypothetical protein
MPWNRLQSASHSASATTNPVTYPGKVQSGTKLIALVSTGAASITSVKDGAGNTFTALATIHGSTGGSVTVGLYALDTPAGDVGTTPTITATVPATGDDQSILVQEVAGLAVGATAVLMLDGTAGTSQATTTASQAQPAYTSSLPNGYLVACFGDNGGPETWTVPAAYTADANGVNNNSTADVVIAYKNSSPGAETGTWAFSGTHTGGAYIVAAFKIAPPPEVFPAARVAVVAGPAGWYGANHSR